MLVLLQTPLILRPKSLPFLVFSKKSDHPKPTSASGPKPRSPNRRLKAEPLSQKPVESKKKQEDDVEFPKTIPRKPRRGRRSEAAAVEDYVRESLEKTFASIREQDSGVFENKENVMKERPIDDESEEEEEEKKEMVVEEESEDWPLDGDIGWGVRASEYFEKHPIRNVVGEDGVEIDWEGEIEDNWVKEINCLEWESFAFHPSPLIVYVFERYNRATDNWKALKELEKAVKVYWEAKDRLPPRSVKIDMNIERDLAYALNVKECPQILFLRGNRILYREKEIRTADELVQMIAHFYYNAKRPSWIDVSALSPPYPY
ncbi:hypothetical protein CsatB_025062 [Cannabis sativa]|uniref:thioredoxin-like fold domain-containing protein MRL7, chloroplastic n=1 Tax=Cannabis sativa TaxID=3483 RepID=UPI0011DFA45B|nr:thioredoxin-like fold domain-containing protein MRL7, chloroplastic [Cannabis sativa]